MSNVIKLPMRPLKIVNAASLQGVQVPPRIFQGKTLEQLTLTQMDILAVLQREPELSDTGFRHSRHGQDTFESGRFDLLDSENIPEFTRARAFLRAVGKPTKTIRPLSSYALKHFAEEWNKAMGGGHLHIERHAHRGCPASRIQVPAMPR